MSAISDGFTIIGDGSSSASSLATAAFTTIEAETTGLLAYTGLATVAFVSDPLRGGVFYYDKTGLTPDNGTIFPASGKSSGYWRRQFDPKDGLNVTWFGAKGDNTTDNTTAITATLNAAEAMQQGLIKVVIPPGRYKYNSTLYVPTGVLLTGSGAIAADTGHATSKLVFAPLTPGTDAIRLKDKGASGSVQIWYGAITNLSLLGNSRAGWAISCRNSAGALVQVIDMSYFENLEMRNFNNGGIEFPAAGVPLYAKNIRGAYMAGSVIKISNPNRSSQAINLHNISGDHNTNGAIWLDQLDTTNNVLITNLKAEAGVNSTFPGQPYDQVNPIICTDCTATIAVDNASSINSADDYGHLVNSATISSTVGSDTFTTFTEHNLELGDRVKIYSTDAFIPGFDQSATFFVVEKDTHTFKLSGTSGGDALKVIAPLAGTPALPATIGVSIYTGFTTIIGVNAGTITAIDGVTVNNTLHVAEHGFINHQQVKFRASGALPTPLLLNKIYYVIRVDDDKFQVEKYIGGGAITLGSLTGTVSAYKSSSSPIGTIVGNVSISGSTFTLAKHGLANNQLVIFPSAGVPAPFVPNTLYFVRDAADNTFKLSDIKGGTAISITGTDTPTVNVYKSSDFRVNRIVPGALISVERTMASVSFTASSPEIPGTPVIPATPLTISVTMPVEPTDVPKLTLTADSTGFYGAVKFYTSNKLPLNIVAGRIYYIVSATLTGTTTAPTTNIYDITISDVKGGAPIRCPDAGSGPHTAYLVSAATTKKPKISWSSASTRLGLAADNKGKIGDDWVSLDGEEPKIIAQTKIGWKSTQGVFNNLVSDNFITLSANPTINDLPEGSSHVYKVGSEVRLWVNDGGTMRYISFS